MYCYWELHAQGPQDDAVQYRIVADGCIDLFINCAIFERLIIAGTTRTATLVPIDGQASYFGIRFLPGGFSRFFSQSVKDLAGNMIDSRDVWGHQLDDFESRLFAAPSMSARIKVAETFILDRLASGGRTPDSRFMAAVDAVIHHQGQIRISGRQTPFGISPRQLRRFFDRHIGVSPKAFARIVRFQSTLRSMARLSHQQWGQRCLDFGYYDQAHFIHEFKTFSGLSPQSANFLQK